MSEENLPAADGGEAPAAPGPLRIKIGLVRQFMECTLKLRGCKAPMLGQGNVFPVDHATGSLKQPFDMACSNCLKAMQDQSKWLIP